MGFSEWSRVDNHLTLPGTPFVTDHISMIGHTCVSTTTCPSSIILIFLCASILLRSIFYSSGTLLKGMFDYCQLYTLFMT